MQEDALYCRRLLCDASSRTLVQIREILMDDDLSDPECFSKIEAILALFEAMGIRCGGCHDFG